MLQAPITPSSYSLRGDRKRKTIMDDAYDDDEEVTASGKARTKSRRELPTGAVATLKAWLLSPEHFTHPYPTPQDQQMLMQKTGIDKKQLKNWFTNARRRIWKPMLKKQIEQGKLTGAAIPPGMLMGNGVGMDNPHSVQAMRVHYQQAIQGDGTNTSVRCWCCSLFIVSSNVVLIALLNFFRNQQRQRQLLYCPHSFTIQRHNKTVPSTHWPKCPAMPR